MGSLAIATCLFLTLSPAASAQTSSRQTLRGHIPPAINALHLQPLNVLPASQQLKLAFSLPLRNPEAASNLLQQLYDPASPNYHHYLTPQEFTEQFGPSEQDYQAVIAFAKANGLTVTGPQANRLFLDVSGSVADIERTFHVTMRAYQHPVENRTFYAPDVEPSLDLSVPVSTIIGLNNYTLPRPLYRRISRSLVSTNQTLYGSAPDGSGAYFSSDFRKAYARGTTLTGSGQTVALFECADYFPFDIELYELYAGTFPGVTLTNVPVDGGAPAPYSGDGLNDEVALDIDMAMSMAPGLSAIYVYEGPGDNPTVAGDILNMIATNDIAQEISSSWLIGDYSYYSFIYTEFAAQGQTFLQASGDEGAYFPGFSNMKTVPWQHSSAGQP